VPHPAIRALFDPLPGRTYLDAATYGLPPRPASDALGRALEAWRTGTARWVDDWDRPTEGVRADFASLIGATAAEIAFVPSASVAMGLVADSLGAGDVVVVPEDEHVSDLFPLLVAERRGVEVRQVPFADLPDAIGERTTLIACSLVQMQTGRVGDLSGIATRARAVGARVFIDATHALPFVPVADHIADIDYLVCHAYKHMLGARGTAFLYVRSDRFDSLTPSYANWRGAPDPWARYVGGPLTLAEDAARFNVSLAWLPWVATVESTRLIADWSQDGTLDEPLRLAARLAESVGQAATGSSLVCVPIDRPEPVRASLEAAGIRAAVRGDAIRFSLHVWNDAADVDRAAEAIRPFLRGSV
jgi:selenocysteine lyase/cysteine desulfurase